jgi:hypothetical protein
MPDQSWDCRFCETTNPPQTEVCDECGNSPKLSPTVWIGAAFRKGTAAIWIGLLVMLGPIAGFLFVANFSALFSTDTIMLWHILSAFGFIFYVPLGLAILVSGINRRRRTRSDSRD